MKDILDDWGNSTLKTLFTVSEMLAIGLGLQSNIFTNMLQGGATKLAPGASDLRRIKKN